MTMKRPLTLAALALGMLVPAANAAARESTDLGAARAATARYHQIAVAEAAGYGLLTDAAGIACIDNPGVGGMGIHYANGTLVGNDSVKATTPEVLVYEPQPNGRLRLVALEYVVFQSAWDAAHTSPPALFGHTFELLGAGNRYGLPPFYELHAWVWDNNKSGLFADYNPNVVCPT
jgi:hypothetical protein